MHISIANKIKKYVFLICFSSSFLFGGCAAIKQETVVPRQGFVQVFKEVNILECVENTPCQKGPLTSVGSGGVIDHHKGFTLILTAAHVCDYTIPESIDKMILKKTKSMKVRTWTGEIIPAKILHSSKNKSIDLCTIYIASPEPKLTKIKVSNKPPKPGDRVLSLAAPAGIYHPPTVPILEGIYSGRIPGGNSSMVTLPAKGGASGALVLNRNFQIIGVIYAVSLQFGQVTISVDYLTTKSFIKESIHSFKSQDLQLPINVLEN